MAFQQGLSGLNATSKNLSVIGNNIANANTYGNKSSRAEFADIYANAVNGSGSNGIGLGVNLAGVEQQFAQGMAPVMPLTRGTLAQHSNQDYQVTITPGRLV